MIHAVPSRLLRAALAIDGAVSGTLAVFQLMAPHPLARVLGLPVELLIGSGAVLAGWTALLVWLANGPAVSRRLVGLVVTGNALWAAACVALVAAAAAPPTPLGTAFLLVQAAAVVALAVAQATGLKRGRRRAAHSGGLAWRKTL